MAKQGKGGPTPPPEDKNPGESDILEVSPIDEPTRTPPPVRKPPTETQLGGPEWVGPQDLVEEVEAALGAKPPAVPPAPHAQHPGESDILEVVPEGEPGRTPPPAKKPPTETQLGGPEWEPEGLVDEVEVVEEVKPPAPPPPSPIDSTVAFEDVQEVDLWEDEPAEVEVVEEIAPVEVVDEAAPVEVPAAEAAPPRTKTPPDDVAGADDFIEIIDPSATLPAAAPPEAVEQESPRGGITPGPQSMPTGKGDVAAHDKIAEALESGTDLTGERRALQMPPPVEAPEVDYDSHLDKLGESSAVDLGEPGPPKPRDRADEVDLLAAALDEGEPKAFVGKGPPSGEEEPVAVVEAEDDRPPAKKPKEKPAQKRGFAGLPWAAGIVIGLVLGGGGVAGLAYTGLLGSGEKKTPPVQAGPKLSPVQLAQGALARNDYDGALEFVKDADKNSPEELAVRGEARWLKYLKEQNDNKAPLSAKDELVKLALADLKEANDEVRQKQITLALGGGTDTKTQQLLKQSEATLAQVRVQLQATAEKLKTVTAASQKGLQLAGLLKEKEAQVAKLTETRNQLDASLAQINKQLKEAKVPGDGAQGVRELAAAKDKLEAERGRLDGVIKQAIQELAAGKLLPPGATVQDLVAGVKAARQRADSPVASTLAQGVSALAGLSEQAARLTQQGATNTLAQTELAFYRLREPLIKTPEKRLGSWAATLRVGPPATPADLDEAQRVADFVLASAGKRDPALKLEAELVRALVARYRGGAAQARTLLDRVAKEAASLKDAASAGEAYFALGRIDEEQGDLAKAESHYRQAIKASRGQPDAARRYRAALARVILMRLDASPVEVPATRERKTGRLYTPAYHALLLLTALTGGGDEGPVAEGRLKEALDLANELLKSENREDKGNAHLLLGKIASLQGRRTEGLREYILGLQLLYPGLATRDLSRMIDEHPAFQQPDGLARPNVAAATSQYSRGLQLFRERQYARAEGELKQAVANAPDDARFRYYLGLARYMQNGRAKREAAVFDFEQAALLERQNRPDPVAVNSSFERLPFALRQLVNRYRQRTPAVAEEVEGK